MKKTVWLFLLAASLNAQAFWKEDLSLTEKTVDYWQPPTVEDFQIPSRPYDQWDYYGNMRNSNLRLFERIIPTYNRKGTLFASWNPRIGYDTPQPTIIILHGGHGINPTELNAARWFRRKVGANILILDSFWSRGKFENHHSSTLLGGNTRTLDVIAAYKWLLEQKEVDKRLIYIYGGSLGGHTVLRAMTDDPFISSKLKGAFRAGFSLYPWCREAPQYGGLKNYHADTDLIKEPWMAPPLGPKYHSDVYVFTGGKDEPTDIKVCDQSIFTGAKEWHHYPEATHSWDLPNRGTWSKAVDGECAKAKNYLLRFNMCRNDEVTYDVWNKIKTVIEKDVSSLSP